MRVYCFFAGIVMNLLGKRLDKGFPSRNKILLKSCKKPEAEIPIIWFHAASAGELESLIPLIELASEQYQIILTFFSASCEEKAIHFANGFTQIIFVGFSPLEGHWHKAFQKWHPVAFITAKYEAWPELWMAAQCHLIPLFVISALPRFAFTIAKILCQICVGKVPHLFFSSSFHRHRVKLQKKFPQSKTLLIHDPRLSRIAMRIAQFKSDAPSQLSSPVQRLLKMRFYPNMSFGVLGNVWPSDFSHLSLPKPWLKTPPFETPFGSVDILFVVPHDLNKKIQVKMCEYLSEFLSQKGQHKPYPYQLHLSSELLKHPKTLHAGDIVFVNQMGFLVELYVHARFAYVGGGFEKGVHSTLEPALAQIPLACGPKRIKSFPEIKMLQDSKQLTVVSNGREWSAWLRSLSKREFKPLDDPALIAQMCWDWIHKSLLADTNNSSL
jgi:3-deoxy-D-manno-octulosonic-acid transferase